MTVGPICESFDHHWQMLAFEVSWDSSSHSLQSLNGQKAPRLDQIYAYSKYKPAGQVKDQKVKVGYFDMTKITLCPNVSFFFPFYNNNINF